MLKNFFKAICQFDRLYKLAWLFFCIFAFLELCNIYKYYGLYINIKDRNWRGETSLSSYLDSKRYYYNNLSKKFRMENLVQENQLKQQGIIKEEKKETTNTYPFGY